MATRSDFAEKLLNDLRLRKEQMAMFHRRSQSMWTVGEIYGNPAQNYKGSRQIKSVESVSSIVANPQRSPNHGHQSLSMTDSPQYMVPLGEGQYSDCMEDPSVALAYTVENRGKLSQLASPDNNSMLNFFHHIGGRPLHTENMERNSTFHIRPPSAEFPGLSPLQVGQELLRGAMDMEESLRMLVTLQEASQYLISPQRRNKIRLLEEDEHDEGKGTKFAEPKQVELPKFSFDKPSRKSSHKRSASCGSDFKPLDKSSLLKDNMSSSQPKQGKVRIPNIIAKLMGLEELPHNVHSKSGSKESSSKQKQGTVSKTTYTSTKHAETKSRDADNPKPPTIEQKLYKTTSQNAKPKVIFPDQKLPKDLEITDTSNPTSGLKRGRNGIDRPGQLYQYTRNQDDFQEQAITREMTKHTEEQTDTNKEEANKPTSSNDLRNNRSPEAKKAVQEEIGFNQETLLKGKRNANMPLSNQEKANSRLGIKKEQVIRKSVPDEEKKPTDQQSAKSRSSVKKQKGTEPQGKNSSKTMPDARNMQKRQNTCQATHSKRSSAEVIDESPLKGWKNGKNWEGIEKRNSRDSDSHKNAPGMELGFEMDKSNVSIPQVKEKPLHGPSVQKRVDHAELQGSEALRRIGEVIPKRNRSSHNSVKPRHHHSSILEEMKQGRFEKINDSKRAIAITGSRFKESEVQNIRPHKSESSSKLQDGSLLLKKEEKPALTLYRIIHTLLTNGKRLEIEADIFGLAEANGASMDVFHLSQHEASEISAPRVTEPLTEDETYLKMILIKCQLFVDTAEMLFNLNIPVTSLHVDDYNGPDEDSKLILDCGYEIMKRKGKRLELALLAGMKISINHMKVTSLDDLVKKLHKDLENIKFYGLKESDECNAADYLYNMIEKDIHNTDPDLNCMWDFGWHEKTFAGTQYEDIIREVERNLVNKLIDEIMQELFSI
ncbi:hypothetical protein NMG60_11024332 [Bertholletia excelsa]